MTNNVPLSDKIDRVIFITADCLRWDHSREHIDVYPNGAWYRHTPQATYTATSHASAFTGLNPPRHGTLDFGMPIRKDNVFWRYDSLSMSNIMSRQGMIPTKDVETIPRIMSHDIEIDFENTTTWQSSITQLSGDDYSMFDSHDFIFLHDWIIHGSGPIYRQDDWPNSMSDEYSIEENKSQYEQMVSKSANIHKDFLKELKEHNLYENTLFILFGDHGQGYGGGAFGNLGHTGLPEEGSAKTPLAFCSPQFDETTVDLQTNPRSVDIMPTLDSIADTSDIKYDESAHEYEGVDLTTFNGELAGYTMSIGTPTTGIGDSVSIAEFSYINNGSNLLFKSVPDDNDAPFELIENQIMSQKLQDMYKTARTEKTKLIYLETPDEEMMEALGYAE